MPIYLISGLLMAAITFFFVGLANILTRAGEQVDDRLERYATRDEFSFISGSEYVPLLGEEEETGGFLTRWLQRRAEGREDVGALRSELARADLKLKVHEWQAIQIMAVAVTALLGTLIFRNIVLGLLMGVLGFFLPRFYLRYRQSKRLNAFSDMLADAIVMLSNSLRAGYSFLQSMEVLSQEMPDPVAMEFSRVVREVGLGLTQGEALTNLYRRVPSQDLDMLITAVNVQQEVGGNLAEILDVLAHTIRERTRIQGEIRVLVAQGMLSGYVITFLPIGLALVLFVMNREYMSQLYATQCGWIMIGTAILMISAGFAAIQKIVRIEV